MRILVLGGERGFAGCWRVVRGVAHLPWRRRIGHYQLRSAICERARGWRP